MDSENFIKRCQWDLADYCNRHMTELGGKAFSTRDFYVVWSVKVLQNSKALLSTDKADGLYFELTYNGDKKEMYVDVYEKRENVCYKN